MRYIGYLRHALTSDPGAKSGLDEQVGLFMRQLEHALR